MIFAIILTTIQYVVKGIKIMLNEFLNERKLPPLKSRKEMLDILQKEEYGYIPKEPDSITYTEDKEYQIQWNEAHSLGLIVMKKIDICCKYETTEFTFPVYVSQSKKGERNRPLIINCGHKKHVGDNLFPTELVAANGFDAISFCYTEVTSDDNDLTDGLAGILYDNGERKDTDAGKIAMWAWAAQRALDYAEACKEFDNTCYVVCGRERLAKAALLAAATDERFTHVFVNASGQSGAALTNGKMGETKNDIIKSKPSFFCENYIKNDEGVIDFDQHYLLASIAPRYIYVAGISEDTYNDPLSEMLSCVAASEAYEKMGKKGLVCEDRLPEADDVFHEGCIGYHLRKDTQYFSYYDWKQAINFIKKHRGEYVKEQRKGLKQLIDKRKLPLLKSREEMLDILQREEYGYLPPKPDSIKFTETTEYLGSSLCEGKAVSKKVDITVSLYGSEFTFPLYMTVPNKSGRFPFFVCVNFQKDSTVFDRMIPTDDIIDKGFGILTFGYQDITKDNEDFTDGLAGIIYKDKERGGGDPSKIAMWAWAAHRVLDYAETQEKLDMSCAIVCGHSRLGKTALLAGATDERFKYVHSNDSGACGAALSRGKIGETQSKMARILRWYCNNFAKYDNNEDAAEFDQHYLLASIAPRYVYVASAYEDTWADPDSEFLSCVAASEEFEKYGKKGFVCEDRLPEIGDEYHEGTIGYHLRSGVHYFGRTDWMKLMKFIIKHEKEEKRIRN